MLTFARIATKPLVFQMLTGLSLQAFLDLLPAFHRATAHIEQQAAQRRKQPRKRQPGGGRKPVLCSDADRLLFILFYFKVYPLQAVQAFFFGMSQARACAWIHRLTPVLKQALGFEKQLPARKAAAVTQVLRACSGLEFISDGTERPIQRSNTVLAARKSSILHETSFGIGETSMSISALKPPADCTICVVTTG
jgi:hypothetical protein